MSVSITCPGCSAVFEVPESLAGKTIRCTSCKTQVTVPDALEAPTKKPFGWAGSAAAATPLELDDEAPQTTRSSKSSPLAKPVAAKKVAAKAILAVDDDEDEDEDDDLPAKRKGPSKSSVKPASRLKKRRDDDDDDEDEDDDDDYDRPKGKKKKKSDEGSGSTVALIVGGVLALLLLGGAGIYFLTRDKNKDVAAASNSNSDSSSSPSSGDGSEKPSGSSGKNNSGSGSNSGVSSSDWQKFSQDGMSVEVPGKPRVLQDLSQDSPIGKIQVKSFVLENASLKQAFLIVCTTMPASMDDPNQIDPFFKGFIDTFIKSAQAQINAAVGNGTKLGIGKTTNIQQDGFTGREFEVLDTTRGAIVGPLRVVIAKKKVYTFMAAAQNYPDFEDQSKRFMTSIKISSAPSDSNNVASGGPSEPGRPPGSNGSTPTQPGPVQPGQPGQPGMLVPGRPPGSPGSPGGPSQPGTITPNQPGNLTPGQAGGGITPGQPQGPMPGQPGGIGQPAQPPGGNGVGPVPGQGGPGGPVPGQGGPGGPVPGQGGPGGPIPGQGGPGGIGGPGGPGGPGRPPGMGGGGGPGRPGGAFNDPNPPPYGANIDGNLKTKIEPFYTAAFMEQKAFFTVTSRISGGKFMGTLTYHAYPSFESKAAYKIPHMATRAVIDPAKALLYIATTGTAAQLTVVPQQYDLASATGDIQVYDLAPLVSDPGTPTGAEIKPLATIAIGKTIRGLELSNDGKTLFVATGTTPSKTTKSGIITIDTESRKANTPKELPKPIWEMRKSADGKSLLVLDAAPHLATENSMLRTLNAETLAEEKVETRLQGVPNHIASAPGSSKGEVVVTVAGSNAGTIATMVMVANSGQHDVQLGVGWKAAVNGSLPGYVEYSPDGKFLFHTAYKAVGLDVYEVNDTESLTTLTKKASIRTAGGSGFGGHIFVSPDGQYLIDHHGIVLETAKIGGSNGAAPEGNGFPGGGQSGRPPGGFGPMPGGGGPGGPIPGGGPGGPIPGGGPPGPVPGGGPMPGGGGPGGPGGPAPVQGGGPAPVQGGGPAPVQGGPGGGVPPKQPGGPGMAPGRPPGSPGSPSTPPGNGGGPAPVQGGTPPPPPSM